MLGHDRIAPKQASYCYFFLKEGFAISIEEDFEPQIKTKITPRNAEMLDSGQIDSFLFRTTWLYCSGLKYCFEVWHPCQARKCKMSTRVKRLETITMPNISRIFWSEKSAIHFEYFRFCTWKIQRICTWDPRFGMEWSFCIAFYRVLHRVKPKVTVVLCD